MHVSDYPPSPLSLSLGCVVSGAGAFEVALADALVKHKPSVKGRAQLGIQAFADALLVIPKVRCYFRTERFTHFYVFNTRASLHSN